MTTKLSREVAAIYDELSSEVRALHLAWRYVHDMTRDLIGVDTFNRASAPFFGTVLSALFEYALVVLSRLLDPPKTGKYDNCSLLALADLSTDVDASLTSSLVRFREEAASLLEYRHKRIAHLDRVITLSDSDDEVPGEFSWVRMHETLRALRQWLNQFESVAGLPRQHYEADESGGDADRVRTLLRKGMSARD